jgi:hypothetical protein
MRHRRDNVVPASQRRRVTLLGGRPESVVVGERMLEGSDIGPANMRWLWSQCGRRRLACGLRLRLMGDRHLYLVQHDSQRQHIVDHAPPAAGDQRDEAEDRCIHDEAAPRDHGVSADLVDRYGLSLWHRLKILSVLLPTCGKTRSEPKRRD